MEPTAEVCAKTTSQGDEAYAATTPWAKSHEEIAIQTIVTAVATRIRPQGFSLALGSIVGPTVLSCGFQVRCRPPEYTLPLALDIHQGISLGSTVCHSKLP